MPNVSRPKNFRVYFLLAALALGGLILLLREHRPSFLRPGLRLYAYVTTADGSVTVVDLVKLKTFSHMYVGPGLSGLREHPSNFPGMANGFTPRLPATTRSSRWTRNRTASSRAPPPATSLFSLASRPTENPSWW